MKELLYMLADCVQAALVLWLIVVVKILITRIEKLEKKEREE